MGVSGVTNEGSNMVISRGLRLTMAIRASQSWEAPVRGA